MAASIKNSMTPGSPGSASSMLGLGDQLADQVRSQLADQRKQQQKKKQQQPVGIEQQQGVYNPAGLSTAALTLGLGPK